jgi:DNA modification methylase
MKKSPSSIMTGDIFRLGAHIVACGDSRNAAFVAKVIGSVKIKAVITDPPYGVAVTESKRNFQALKKDKVIENDHLQTDAEYEAFTADWLLAVIPHLAKKNALYIFNSDKMIFALRDGMRNVGCKFAQLIVWVKTQAVVGRMDYAPMHELIAYGWHGTHEFLKSKDKSVIVHPKPSKSPFHPTTKPVPLIRHLILNSTRIGDAVYDAFLGSGTALLACEQTKRVCIGIELDPEYVQTAIDRWEKLAGDKAVKLVN